MLEGFILTLKGKDGLEREGTLAELAELGDRLSAGRQKHILERAQQIQMFNSADDLYKRYPLVASVIQQMKDSTYAGLDQIEYSLDFSLPEPDCPYRKANDPNRASRQSIF